MENSNMSPIADRKGRPTLVRWQIVALLVAIAGINHFNRTCMAVAAPELKEQFGLSDPEMGATYSAFLLAYVIFMIPGGWFADRFGPRLALAISGFGTAVFVCLTGFGGLGILAGSLAFASFLAIRFCMGAFTAPLFPAAGRAVANWIPFSRSAWANGLVIGAPPLGVGISHVVFGGLKDGFGWRTAFLITGCATGLLTFVWWLFARNRPSQHLLVNQAEIDLISAPPPAAATDDAALTDVTAGTAEHVAGNEGRLTWQETSSYQPLGVAKENPFRSPRVADKAQAPVRPLSSVNGSLILVTLIYVAVGYFEYMLFYWMKHYFEEVRHFSEADSRFFSMLAPLPMMVTMPLGGWISDKLVPIFGYRIGRSSVAIFGMLASAALLPLASLVEGQASIVLLVMLAHAAIGLCEAPTWVAAIELGGANCATSSAIVNTGGNFGGMISPYMTPVIGQYFGWAWGMGAGSILCLLGVCLWIWIDPTPRSSKRDPALPDAST